VLDLLRTQAQWVASPIGLEQCSADDAEATEAGAALGERISPNTPANRHQFLCEQRLSLVKISQTPPRSRSNILAGRLPLEAPGLQPEAVSSSLQTLWVEVGCRHVQTLAPEKECHEYGEDSKPAL
jgi:hypothetical protein